MPEQGHGHAPKGPVALLALGALGIVYGDIGTSPLYAFRETFHGHGHELPVTETNVLGLLSLVFWSLIVVISIKYLLFVMRADNRGEGGILALVALIRSDGGPRSRRYALILLGVFGTALLYGDAAITPAISVLSAVEGTEVAAPALSDWVVPISCAILVALFLIQQRGTDVIARFFGPIMVVWFSVLALLGVAEILSEPGVLRAVNPAYAARFFSENGRTGFLALGAVFLVVTGGEALYADMGHFGRRPIKLAWFTVVLPALLLNYFGQGALLIADHEAVESPFFNLAPSWSLYPLVALATAATIIASQALISGVFSLTLQAIQLGYAPRHRVRHTSAAAMGQIYIPVINWALMAACIALVIGFGSSANLAAAYGVAVTSTMLITTVLFYVVLRERFEWSLGRAASLCALFLVIDTAFLGANVFKIPAGGWFPLLVAGGMFTLMTTWRTGRRLVAARSRRNFVPLKELVRGFERSPEGARRVPGTAMYMFSSPGLAPPALVANLRHNDALHERVIITAVVTEPEPRLLPAQRATVEELGQGIHQLVLRYGFMEEPDVPEGMCQGAARRLSIDPARVTYFLGAEILRVTEREGMAMWREHLFALISRNTTPAAVYFNLPLPQTIIVGTAIEL
ncbi:MAG TPA: potassium transporter Kup [Acidimicrobiia bacterium]|nr:potassium transporter Kup [Acidimicrobiia bacterium]